MVGAAKRRRRGGGGGGETVNSANTSPPPPAPSMDKCEADGAQNTSTATPGPSIVQFDGPSSGPPNSPRGRPVNPGIASPRGNSPMLSPTSRGGSPSRGASPGRSIAGTAKFPVDPARDPARNKPARFTDMCKNIDLPASAYNLDELFFKYVDLAPRPGYNTTGREVILALNHYPITSFPTVTVHQYDVIIGNGVEKRAVVQKVWESNARKQALGRDFIFDGNKLAWSQKQLAGGANFVVDLDAEQGRSSLDSKRSNAFRVVIRYTKSINLAMLEQLVRGNKALGKDGTESLNFLDHLLRETPSQKFIALKRSFFSTNNQMASLGGGVFAYKGVYQAIRVVNPGRLTVNVDVSNACFWARTSLLTLAVQVLELRDPQQLISDMQAVPNDFGGVKYPRKWSLLERMRKLVVRAQYPGCPCPTKDWTIKGFHLANAKQYTIDIKNPATGQTRTISIYDYFKERYNITIRYWQLPLVQMTKKSVVYPMEVLVVERPQKYPFKLNDLQTASMIKFAVTRPGDRRQAIEQSKKTLEHGSDPVLNAYGLRIGDSMVQTKARLLPNPEILFGGNQRVNPGTAGRWDLRGKKFYSKNSKPLKSWGVGYFKGRNPIQVPQIEAFVDALVKAYQGHGGEIANRRPHIMELQPDAGPAMYDLFHATGNKFNLRPEFLIIIVADRQSFHWTRIKKSADCRFGIPSQVLQAAQVAKCNGQYISNVLMKINAKLGGTTARTVSKITSGLKPFTMIVGADVSHSSPGSIAPSMAAMTVSMDAFGGRYTAGCETNGEHVEIISQANIKSILSPLFREWVMNIGQGRVPQNIYYFRDGISEGQYQHVLQQELPFIKAILKEIGQGKEWTGKMTVVIASKRHHTRAFPIDKSASDKNGNPLPGTLVERDATDPQAWDFLLYSHIALQGTSRPVHYHVLLDEMKHKPSDLQNMIYEHCYQYMRSTTSVSLFPAVYYAHLASNRARSHENIPASSGPQSGPGTKQNQPPPDVPKLTETPQLLPMPEADRLAFKMWYI